MGRLRGIDRLLPRGRMEVVAPPLLLFILLALWGLTHPPGLTGDTVALVKGAHQIADCLGDGVHSECDFVGGVPEGAVAPYPLLQYLPALGLTQLGVDDTGVYRWLMVLNLTGFAAIAGLGGWTAAASGRRWAAPLFLATLVGSPLLWYTAATFAEPLAAALVLALTVGALRRWPPWVLALLALLAAITKETAFPFTLALAALCLLRTPLPVPDRRRAHVAGLVGGTLLAVVLNGAFNWFRYRQLTNFTYGHAYFRVPGIGLKLEFSTALWVAPNGGVLWFWPLATLVLLTAIVAAIVGLRRGPTERPVAWAAAALLVIVLLQTGTLGSWWAPFGWVAWGPRLMLPLLPAAVLAAIVLLGPALGRVVARLSGAAWVVVAIVVAALALPNALVLSDPAAVSNLFTLDARCPTVPNILPDADYYYGCVKHYAYGRHLVLVDAIGGDHADWGLPLGIAGALAAAALIGATATRRCPPAQPTAATTASVAAS